MKRKKKLLVSAAAIVSAAAVAGVNVYASREFEPEDLHSLSSAILGESELSSWQDINQDGRIDAFDLVVLRRKFAHTGSFTEQTIPLSSENVRYIGRNIYTADNTLLLVQSGSAAEFVVTGKSASVTVCGDRNTASDAKWQPRYAVLVDGEIIKDDLISGEETITLFEGTESRTAVVKVIHLSEANNGAVGVKNLSVDSDVNVPVSPTAKKELQIEFIGDSITCAYGVEGKDQYEGFMTSTENFMKSYAYLTAQQLDADYSAVCYSGHGIISGYSSDGSQQTDSLVPDYYDNVGKLKGYDVPWDFENSHNDVVVINLGTNDNTYVSVEPETRGPEFTAAYVDFLMQVHKNNPDAYIICTLGTMGCTEEYPFIEEAVSNFKKKAAYDRIMCYKSATHTQSDGFGADWHPSPKTQQNSAYVLADKICQALGMESDQIGIDVAADVEFNSVQSDSAMMSAYFSDWDRSYHVTTVYGGDTKESIQIFAGDIGVKKGGVYHLQFLAETAADTEIPFCLRSKSDGKILYEDVLTGSGSKSQFEADFTCPETCDAELVFSMGGTDSLRLSLYELKMIKKK